MTKIVKPSDLDGAAKALKAGGLVVFPTETVYGLGADSSNAAAIEKIYKAITKWMWLLYLIIYLLSFPLSCFLL